MSQKGRKCGAPHENDQFACHRPGHGRLLLKIKGMAENKPKGQNIWGGLFAAQPSNIMEAINGSIDV